MTPTFTPSITPANTATQTPTLTITPTATDTPTPIPTLVHGRFPAESLLPQIAQWFSPAVRGLLALAPPSSPRPSSPRPNSPQPNSPQPAVQVPGTPCTGVPGGLGNPGTTGVLADTFNCGRCVDVYGTGDPRTPCTTFNDYSNCAQPLIQFWQENKDYVAGALVAPINYNGFAFRAQNDGRSGIYINPDGTHGEPPWPAKLSATISDNSVGCNLPGNPQCLVWKAEPEPLCGFVDVNPADGFPDLSTPGVRNELPLPDRGFDDPQADPDLTFLSTGRKIYITYKRADIWNFPQPPGCAGDPNHVPPIPPNPDNCIFPYQQQANDARNGNPPWGSQPSFDPLSNPPNDNDADGVADDPAHPWADRRNRGAYASYFNFDRYQFSQQAPNDAFAEPSHPLKATCNVYSEDCGGIAHFNNQLTMSTGDPYTPYIAGTEPPAPETWPLVPFPRDWGPFKSTDGDSATAIKRLLRFASSIVSFNSEADHMSEYTLAEDSTNVVVMSPGTPIAGSLKDAYNYFKNSVIAQADPFAECRLLKVILITDGLESAGADSCSGGSISGFGPAGDLKTINVPVIVVAMGLQNPALLNCIADNSGGQVIPANDRPSVVDALQGATASTSTVGVNLFSSPALPALSTSSGDVAIIGAIVPSHKEPTQPAGDASNASWAIWNGALKAYKLDENGRIPTVTAVTTVTPTPAGTATTTPVSGFPDETTPNTSDPTARRPVWNAARMLGYTDPTTNLVGDEPSVAPPGGGNGLPLNVWPGRKIVWGDGTGPTVPIPRRDFMPNDPATCGGIVNPGDCFYDLMVAMSLTPTVPTDVTKAVQTVQFLRGGKTKPTTLCNNPNLPCPGSRDEILTDLGAYGTVKANTIYSYFYQDDVPLGNPAGARTDGGSNPPGYSHKLGDIFHSEASMVAPPKYFQYLSANLTPRTSTSCINRSDSGPQDCSYVTFASLHAKRRKVVFVGTNDGFLHAFDAGVFDRDDTNFNDTWDLGTGREIFAFAPKSLMPARPNPTRGFVNLLNFPPKVQYFVDGSPVVADVFIDTAHGGVPSEDHRTWRTVLVSGLRQGGQSYFALDVTQPDQYNSDGSGLKAGLKDSVPDCLNGGGSCAGPYPSVLWEYTDIAAPAMGETWSRPVIGRIHVANGGGFVDRYVAIFGGGFDSTFVPQAHDILPADPSKGRAIYIVNVETGQRLYKAIQGTDSARGTLLFAPMPAPPAVADVDDDGFLDVAYIGDLNGRMWRLGLTNGSCDSCNTAAEKLTFADDPHHPFLLYDSKPDSQPIQPIFLDAGIIFVSGGTPPIVGVAYGTGYRAELLRTNPNVNRFFYVIDPGIQNKTFHEGDLANITPEGGITPAGDGPPDAAHQAGACMTDEQKPCGYFLDFAGKRPGDPPTFSLDEKAISTVFSTLGNLSLATFIPDDTGVLCGNGTSYRYSFFYSTGQGGYNLNGLGVAGQLTDYRQDLGSGLVALGQYQSPTGDVIDTVLFSGASTEAGQEHGTILQENTRGTLKTINQNWKEQ